MKITLHSSLVVCAATVLIGVSLSGCSNSNKVDLSHMSKDQQIQAVGQMDSQTRAIEQSMLAKMQASRPQPGAKANAPQLAAPTAGKQ